MLYRGANAANTIAAPAAWFAFRKGITVTGAGVSRWADRSANGRHLLQTTDAARPGLASDGSVLFNGSSHFLQCTAFTLDQPATIYLLFRQVTWTANDVIAAGTTVNSRIVQNSATPQIALFAGSGPNTGNTDLAVNTYGVLAAVFNGASSLIQVNNGTPTTGNPGAGALTGFTLGANNAGAAFSNIQVKEAIVFAAAHSATERAAVNAYLAKLGGL